MSWNFALNTTIIKNTITLITIYNHLLSSVNVRNGIPNKMSILTQPSKKDPKIGANTPRTLRVSVKTDLRLYFLKETMKLV